MATARRCAIRITREVVIPITCENGCTARGNMNRLSSITVRPGAFIMHPGNPDNTIMTVTVQYYCTVTLATSGGTVPNRD